MTPAPPQSEIRNPQSAMGMLRRAWAIAVKEMRHLLREPRTLMVVFGQPVMLLILYGYCINFDLQRLPFAVWDQDHTRMSRDLVDHLNAGAEHRAFELEGYVTGPHEIEPLLAQGKVRFVLVIPPRYGENLTAGKRAEVQALFDGADSNTAGVASGYLGAAIATENARLITGAISREHGSHTAASIGTARGGDAAALQPIDIRWRTFYNPDLSSRRFIIPGLIAILLTFVAASLTSTSIVRERELGPLESLLISPIGPVELVIGKMLPYVLVAAGDIVLVLVVGGFIFDVWPRGSLITLGSLTFFFLLGMLSVGMLISAVAPSQQIALLLATLATMLPNFFLTGFAYPRSNMPWLLQVISYPIPATQFLIAIRGVFLKGIGWEVLWPQALWMLITTVALTAQAMRVMRGALTRGLEPRRRR
jgi:ABC-2 type transport system permease protein